MKLAIIGFVLMIVLMYVLIREKLSPIVAFIMLPLIAAAIAGNSLSDISGYVQSGMETMLSMAILFIFSISYFSMMSEAGLFDPIINFLVKKMGKTIVTIFLAIVVVTFIAHLDGSGTAARMNEAEVVQDSAAEKKTSKPKYFFNLILTIVMLAILFMNIDFPLYAIFMIAFPLL